MLGVLNFEGGYLFNLGGANSGNDRNFFTSALGLRSRLSDEATLDIAYEIPLTEKEESLIEDRIILDLVRTS